MTKWGLCQDCKDYFTLENQSVFIRIKGKKYIIIDAKSALDKNQHPFQYPSYIKNSQITWK